MNGVSAKSDSNMSSHHKGLGGNCGLALNTEKT